MLDCNICVTGRPVEGRIIASYEIEKQASFRSFDDMDVSWLMNIKYI
jgi:hypothetical protein